MNPAEIMSDIYSGKGQKSVEELEKEKQQAAMVELKETNAWLSWLKDPQTIRVLKKLKEERARIQLEMENWSLRSDMTTEAVRAKTIEFTIFNRVITSIEIF